MTRRMSLLSLLIPALLAASAPRAAEAHANRVGLGFDAGTTVNPSTLMFGGDIDIFLGDAFSLGPKFSIGLGAASDEVDTLILVDFVDATFRFRSNQTFQPFFKGGLGLYGIDFDGQGDDDELAPAAVLGFGAEIWLGRRVMLVLTASDWLAFEDRLSEFTDTALSTAQLTAGLAFGL